jgi:hypothetical protein
LYYILHNISVSQQIIYRQEEILPTNDFVLLIFCFTVNHRFIEGVGSIKKIAFHATLTHDIRLGQSQTVVFDHVITNNGNGYSKHSGLFTAPRDGTYYFTTSFLSRSGSVHLQMHLQRDLK